MQWIIFTRFKKGSREFHTSCTPSHLFFSYHLSLGAPLICLRISELFVSISLLHIHTSAMPCHIKQSITYQALIWYQCTTIQHEPSLTFLGRQKQIIPSPVRGNAKSWISCTSWLFLIISHNSGNFQYLPRRWSKLGRKFFTSDQPCFRVTE